MAIGAHLQLERADLVNTEVFNVGRPEALLNFGGHHRLPVIVQTEMAECGLACLAMMAGYYGFDTDMTSLRRRFAISSHGTNLKQLIEMVGRLHLSPRALRADLSVAVEKPPC